MRLLIILLRESHILFIWSKNSRVVVEIDKTDVEIDAMVYELYDFTEEEIQIVENN